MNSPDSLKYLYAGPRRVTILGSPGSACTNTVRPPLRKKEVLGGEGAIVMEEVRRCGATLLPVDSEHNAIWQCFDLDRADTVERIILTASGGPFRERAFEDMREVTPMEAVAHPNWSMGAKISVDSATMMNKGLELSDAHHLFQLPLERG